MIWLLLIIVAIAAWAVGMFNGLIVLRNRVDEAASDIDVQLKRRHDLVPNLINTVKGYATHEQQLFERVTEARSQAVSAGNNLADRAEAENMLTSSLRSLFAVAENYPDLKANQNFLALQEELADTENKIMASRRFYNSNVRDYNIRRETVPTSILANYFKFGKREQFELEDLTERELPKVDFTPAAPMAAAPVVAPAFTPEPVVTQEAPQTAPVQEHLIEDTNPVPPTAQEPQNNEPSFVDNAENMSAPDSTNFDSGDSSSSDSSSTSGDSGSSSN